MHEALNYLAIVKKVIEKTERVVAEMNVDLDITSPTDSFPNAEKRTRCC